MSEFISAYALRRSARWRYELIRDSRWDKCYAPVYEAVGRGRRIPLLKTLLASFCRYGCAYCALRQGMRRGAWGVERLVNATIALSQSRRIEGLFLSSTVFGDPDRVVERELEVVERLRRRGYTGYIHLKVMPGTSRYLVERAAELADRVGVNLEAPLESAFSEVCPDKGGFREAVLKRLEWISEAAEKWRRRGERPRWGFGRAGVDTQFVVGATDEPDKTYLELTQKLYHDLKLSRVYFSGFEPIPNTPLEKRRSCPPWRELRLYQASFLIRDYGFSVEQLDEILDDFGNLPNKDPKEAYAEAHPELFPIDLNQASLRELLLIPGIGLETAKRIVAARSVQKIETYADLRRVLGRALARKIAPYVSFGEKGALRAYVG